MRLAIAIVSGVLLTAAPTFAQSDGRGCAALTDDARRLLCYDTIFKMTPSTPAAIGSWMVREETSKIDDSKNVRISVESEEPLPARFGRKERATLMVACREKKTTAFIVFGGHFMSSLTGGDVVIRIDKRPAQTRQMRESNDHQALGLWSLAEARPFLRDLFDAETLIIRATPHSESAVTAEFRVSGLREAIKPLQAACGWADTPASQKTKTK